MPINTGSSTLLYTHTHHSQHNTHTRTYNTRIHTYLADTAASPPGLQPSNLLKSVQRPEGGKQRNKQKPERPNKNNNKKTFLE